MTKIQLGYCYAHYIAKFLFFLTLFSGQLSSAIINVPADAPTVQAAVNLAASSGDTIQIAAGTYIEQVQIVNKSLNIVGAGQNSTIIKSPGASTPLTQYFTFGPNFWCVVMVDNQAAPTPQIVNISALTVDGNNQQDTATLPPPSPGYYGSPDRFFAIGYHNAGGTVLNVHTTNTRQTSNFDQLAGGGIVNASNSGAVTFNVTNCLVDFYQRQGIDCRGNTLTANISGSTVNRGYILPPNTATATPNGIQYSGATTGSITNNTIEGNIATVSGAASSGLIPFGAGPNLLISGNTLNNNDIGIAAIQNDNNLIIQSNTLNFTITPGVNLDEGILVQDTNGLTTLTSNIMNNIPNVAMDLISSGLSAVATSIINNNPDILLTSVSLTNQPFQLANNQFIGSQTGLIVTGNTTVGPVVTMNSDSFTGTVGYYIQEVAAPNDIWPSTATVSFDGLVSGHITFAEYTAILTKIFDKHNDPALGLVLDFIIPSPPILISINPNSGPTSGGNTITITGSGFLSSNTTVYFGTTQGTNVVVISDTTITVTVPPGTGTVDVTVVTPFGTTPIVPAGEYTYIVDPPLAPLPPSNFIGCIEKNKFLNKTEFVLTAQWDPSPSPDVVLYRIYLNGYVVDEIPSGFPLTFVTCLKSKKQAKNYEIVAVNSLGLESAPIPIRIIHE